MRAHGIKTGRLGIELLIGLLAVAVWGQDQPSDGRADQAVVARAEAGARFGPASVHYKSLSSKDFQAAFPNTIWGYFNDNRQCGGGPDYFNHGVDLPSGVLLEAVSWVLADVDSVTDMYTHFCKTPWAGGPGSANCQFVQATSGAPGFTRPVHVVNEIIDNESFSYWIAIQGCGPARLFRQARLAYRYQVSPSPGIATFGDVPPTHPQFPFVEALVRSGITAGCGNANYCPDAPLTRGQMAVFLSKGLGLHFAP